MKGLIFAFMFLFCSGCSTLSVEMDYNPAFDFSRLHSYAWLDEGKQPSTDVRINNDLVIDRVRKAVEMNLAAKGYIKADIESADFHVSWLGAIKKKLQGESIDHFYSPYGYHALHHYPYYWSGPAMRTTTIREYEVGTLIIDILDPGQHKLIWRGSGSDRLSSSSNPEEITRKINEAVFAIMKGFPPVK